MSVRSAGPLDRLTAGLRVFRPADYWTSGLPDQRTTDQRTTGPADYGPADYRTSGLPDQRTRTSGLVTRSGAPRRDGSRAARHAGRAAASRPAAASRACGPTSGRRIRGGEAEQQRAALPRIAATASGRPIASPAPSSRRLSRSSRRTICARVEPSDRRMPISCRRLTARYAMRPYSPTVTSAIARTPKVPASHAIIRSPIRRSRICVFSSTNWIAIPGLRRPTRCAIARGDSRRRRAGADDHWRPRVRTGILCDRHVRDRRHRLGRRRTPAILFPQIRVFRVTDDADDFVGRLGETCFGNGAKRRADWIQAVEMASERSSR